MKIIFNNYNDLENNIEAIKKVLKPKQEAQIYINNKWVITLYGLIESGRGETMNSYEFEVTCKNALIDKLKEKYNEDLTIKDLHLVWFSKTLHHFKCIIIDLRPNKRMYECTYNGIKNELYVDIYNKEYNFKINENELQKEVLI